jgi:hypothetical protein
VWCLLIVSNARDEAAFFRLEEFLSRRVPDLCSLGPGVFVSGIGSSFPPFEWTVSAGGTIDGLPEETKVYVVRADGEAELLFERPPPRG